VCALERKLFQQSGVGKAFNFQVKLAYGNWNVQGLTGDDHGKGTITLRVMG
jgi:hypothetical protein